MRHAKRSDVARFLDLNLFLSGFVDASRLRSFAAEGLATPPDIILVPRLSPIGLLEFYRAREAIEEGKECVRRILPEIRHLVKPG